MTVVLRPLLLDAQAAAPQGRTTRPLPLPARAHTITHRAQREARTPAAAAFVHDTPSLLHAHAHPTRGQAAFRCARAWQWQHSRGTIRARLGNPLPAHRGRSARAHPTTSALRRHPREERRMVQQEPNLTLTLKYLASSGAVLSAEQQVGPEAALAAVPMHGLATRTARLCMRQGGTAQASSHTQARRHMHHTCAKPVLPRAAGRAACRLRWTTRCPSRRWRLASGRWCYGAALPC